MFLLEHDLRANASRLSRGKTGTHFSGSSAGLQRPSGVAGEVLDSGLRPNILRPADPAEGRPMPSAAWRQRTFLHRPQTNGLSFEITRSARCLASHDGSDCNQAPPELGVAGARPAWRADRERARTYPSGCPLSGLPELVHAVGHRPEVHGPAELRDFPKNFEFRRQQVVV